MADLKGLGPSASRIKTVHCRVELSCRAVILIELPQIQLKKREVCDKVI